MRFARALIVLPDCDMPTWHTLWQARGRHVRQHAVEPAGENLVQANPIIAPPLHAGQFLRSTWASPEYEKLPMSCSCDDSSNMAQDLVALRGSIPEGVSWRAPGRL